jgi:regulator of protease activity HflC (stomatin/prohibitin superfamily)
MVPITATLLAVVFLLAGCRIATQYRRAVVFRLGKYHRTKGPGFYWNIPLVEWQTVLDLRTVTSPLGQQEAITRDNVPVKIDAVIWYRTVNPEKAVMEVANVYVAVSQVALTTLRNAIGIYSLDDILKEREKISVDMQKRVDAVTEPWGIKVEMVEIRNVEIPASMQRAMAQEAEALREKRARLIKAQAEFEAAEQLKNAARLIMESPAGLELRRMQMITEVGAEQNTTTIIMMPSEFVTAAKAFADAANRSATPLRSGG